MCPTNVHETYPINKFPQSLFMKISKKNEQIKSPHNLLPIYLTINFNEAQQKTAIGSLYFGLQGGDLCLELDNGIMPYESRTLLADFEPQLKAKRVRQVSESLKKEQNESQQQSASLANFIPSGEFSSDLDKSSSAEDEEIITDSFDITLCQVSAKGSEEQPIWSFKCKTGSKILRGTLVERKLGYIKIISKPLLIKGTFHITSRDVVITEVSGLLPKKLTQNKLKIIKLIMLKKLIDSYLSKDFIKHE